MTESKKAREEREAAEAAAAAEANGTVEPLELSEEGFDVTQPPPSDLDGKSVDYSKTTMQVVGDSERPADFDPASNR